MKYTVFSVTSTHGSMYRMAHISFHGHVMGPSLRPNFQSFFSSSSSSPSPAPLEEDLASCSCAGGARRHASDGPAPRARMARRHAG